MSAAAEVEAGTSVAVAEAGRFGVSPGRNLVGPGMTVGMAERLLALVLEHWHLADGQSSAEVGKLVEAWVG